MPETQCLEFSVVARVEPKEVVRAFTHATLLRDWLCADAKAYPRPGGAMFLLWRDGRTAVGSYEQLDPERDVTFTWLFADNRSQGRVRVACAAEGDGTRVTLTHEVLDPGQGGVEVVENLKTQWPISLENLVSVLETGVDLRVARRPRLGIMMDEFSAETAQRLGVPVSEGVRLVGTAEGSGARAAGLEKDDVLVSMNGVPLVDYTSIDSALRGLSAGDRPVVEYYRGAEKRSTPLELGHFAVPPVPETAAAAAAQAREGFARILSAMREQVGSVADDRAGVAPAEGQWSVKELVAHFILCERDYQSWVADMVNDTPVEDWLQMRCNVQPRITALVQRLGTLEALLGELALAFEETAAMIAAFPETLVRRKHLYRRAILWAIGTPDHYFEEHKEQFQKAMA